MKMKNYFRNVLRPVSVLVIQAFLVQQVSFAVPVVSPVRHSLTDQLRVQFAVPESMARVENSYQSRSGDKMIVLMQDAHTNESGQINLSKALQIILDAENIQYVFTEAGYGDDSLTFLKQFGTAENRKHIGLQYLRKGQIKGTEYLNFTSDTDFKLWGVEDKTLYDESLESYRAIADERTRYAAYLVKINQAISALKPKIYSARLNTFDEAHEAFLQNELSLTRYIETLLKTSQSLKISHSVFPHLGAFAKLTRKEAEVNFDAAGREQAQAIAALSTEDQAILKKAAEEQSDLHVKQDIQKKQAFYLELEAKIKDTAEFPNLLRYIAYIKKAGEINPAAILVEQKTLEARIYDALAKKPVEKRMVIASRYANLLKNLFDLKLTPEDYALYEKDSKRFGIVELAGFINREIMLLESGYERGLFLEDEFDAAAKHAEEFYALTRARDEVFVDRALDEMEKSGEKKAVLVTGGYHTQNLESLLKARDISYVVVTPQVFHETDHKRYERLLLGQKDADDQTLLTRGKSYEPVSKALMTQDSPHTASGVAVLFDMTKDFLKAARDPRISIPQALEIVDAEIARILARAQEGLAAQPVGSRQSQTTPASLAQALRRAAANLQDAYDGMPDEPQDPQFKPDRDDPPVDERLLVAHRTELKESADAVISGTQDYVKLRLRLNILRQSLNRLKEIYPEITPLLNSALFDMQIARERVNDLIRQSGTRTVVTVDDNFSIVLPELHSPTGGPIHHIDPLSDEAKANLNQKTKVAMVGMGQVLRRYGILNLRRLIEESNIELVIVDVHDPEDFDELKDQGLIAADGKHYNLPVENYIQVSADATPEDIAERLRDEGFDAMWVQTPPETHFAYLKAGLLLGIEDIAVEKPLVVTDDYAETEQLLQEHPNQVFALDHFLNSEATLELLRFLADNKGELGEIEMIEGNLIEGRMPDPGQEGRVQVVEEGRGKWFLKKGNGGMRDMLLHVFFVLLAAADNLDLDISSLNPYEPGGKKTRPIQASATGEETLAVRYDATGLLPDEQLPEDPETLETAGQMAGDFGNPRGTQFVLRGGKGLKDTKYDFTVYTSEVIIHANFGNDVTPPYFVVTDRKAPTDELYRKTWVVKDSAHAANTKKKHKTHEIVELDQLDIGYVGNGRKFFQHIGKKKNGLLQTDSQDDQNYTDEVQFRRTASLQMLGVLDKVVDGLNTYYRGDYPVHRRGKAMDTAMQRIPLYLFSPQTKAAILGDLERGYDNWKTKGDPEGIVIKIESMYDAYPAEVKNYKDAILKAVEKDVVVRHDRHLKAYAKWKQLLERVNSDREDEPMNIETLVETLVNESNRLSSSTVTMIDNDLRAARRKPQHSAITNRINAAIEFISTIAGTRAVKDVMDVSGTRMVLVGQKAEEGAYLTGDQVESVIEEGLAKDDNFRGKRVLISVPDLTRKLDLGQLMTHLYEQLKDSAFKIDVMIALGTHDPLSEEDIDKRLVPSGETGTVAGHYPGVTVYNHDWKNNVREIGVIKGSEIAALSEGTISPDNPLATDVPVTLNKFVSTDNYDVVLVVGGVEPHEVAGTSNGGKMFFPGMAGQQFLGRFHLVSALEGIGNVIGRIDTTARRLINRAMKFVYGMGIEVRALNAVVDGNKFASLYYGTLDVAFKSAAIDTLERNVVYHPKSYRVVVAAADPGQFGKNASMWVVNKLEYRTRGIVAPGGVLVEVAPDITEFSEKEHAQHLLNMGGYRTKAWVEEHWADLARRQIPEEVIAHSIHGSAEDFRIVWATGVDEQTTTSRLHVEYADPNRIDVEGLLNRMPEALEQLVKVLGLQEHNITYDDVFVERPAGKKLHLVDSRLAPVGTRTATTAQEAIAFKANFFGKVFWDADAKRTVNPAEVPITVHDHPWVKTVALLDEEGRVVPKGVILAPFHEVEIANSAEGRRMLKQTQGIATSIRQGIAEAYPGKKLKYIIWPGMGGSIEDKYAALAAGVMGDKVRFFGLDDVNPETLGNVYEQIIQLEAKALGKDPVKDREEVLKSALQQTVVAAQALGMTSVEPVFNVKQALGPTFDVFGLERGIHFKKITIPGSLLDQGLTDADGVQNITHQISGLSTAAGRHDYISNGLLLPLILSGGNALSWMKALDIGTEDIQEALNLANWIVDNHKEGLNKVILGLPKEWQGRWQNGEWQDASFWIKQHFEESLGKDPGKVLKVVNTRKVASAEFENTQGKATDKTFLVVKVHGLTSPSDADIARLRAKGYKVFVLNLDDKTSEAQGPYTLARLMQIMTYTKYSVAHKWNVTAVNQPPVEFYKRIVNYMRDEDSSKYNDQSPEARYKEVQDLFDKSGYSVTDPHTGITLNYTALITNGSVTEDDISNEIRDLKLDPKSTADVAGAIHRIALRKLGPRAYGEVMYSGNLSRGADAQALRETLDRSAAYELWQKTLKSHADIGKGPGAGHATHAMGKQGQVLTTNILPENHLATDPLVAEYETDYQKQNWYANVLALAGYDVVDGKLAPVGHPGLAILLQIPQNDAETRRNLEDYHSRIAEITQMRQTRIAGSRPNIRVNGREAETRAGKKFEYADILGENHAISDLLYYFGLLTADVYQVRVVQSGHAAVSEDFHEEVYFGPNTQVEITTKFPQDEYRYRLETEWADASGDMPAHTVFNLVDTRENSRLRVPDIGFAASFEINNQEIYRNATVMYPFVNRVDKGKLRGRDIRELQGWLDVGDGHALHGLVRRRAWNIDEVTANAEGLLIRGSIEIGKKEGSLERELFGHQKLTVTYQVIGGDVVTTSEVQNLEPERDIEYGLGYHHNWVVDKDRVRVTVPAKKVYQTRSGPNSEKPDLIPINAIPVEGRFDLREPTSLAPYTQGNILDDVFTDLGLNADNGESTETIIEDTGLGYRTRLVQPKDMDHIVVFTGRMERDGLVGIEAQNVPTNHHNRNESQHLGPGKSAKTVIRSSTAEFSLSGARLVDGLDALTGTLVEFSKEVQNQLSTFFVGLAHAQTREIVEDHIWPVTVTTSGLLEETFLFNTSASGLEGAVDVSAEGAQTFDYNPAAIRASMNKASGISHSMAPELLVRDRSYMRAVQDLEGVAASHGVRVKPLIRLDVSVLGEFDLEEDQNRQIFDQSVRIMAQHLGARATPYQFVGDKAGVRVAHEALTVLDPAVTAFHIADADAQKLYTTEHPDAPVVTILTPTSAPVAGINSVVEPIRNARESWAIVPTASFAEVVSSFDLDDISQVAELQTSYAVFAGHPVSVPTIQDILQGKASLKVRRENALRPKSMVETVGQVLWYLWMQTKQLARAA